MSSEAVITVKNLSCFSGSRYLLNQITWRVNRGEQWVVFGRNGCGKTTLLSIIGGYKRFSAGTLEVFGQPYTAENVLDIRKKIGWISSSFFDNYYHQELVIDIVLAGLSGTLGLQFDISNANIVKAKELLKGLGIGDKIYMPFDMLSKGERQHVLIARAFMTSPEVLILDEPGTGLDVLARERLLKTIQKLAMIKKITIIYVTHYLEEILPSFNKCLLLRDGVGYKIGNTQEIITTVNMSNFFNYPVKIDVNKQKFNFSIDADGERQEVDQLIRKAGYYAN